MSAQAFEGDEEKKALIASLVDSFLNDYNAGETVFKTSGFPQPLVCCAFNTFCQHKNVKGIVTRHQDFFTCKIS